MKRLFTIFLSSIMAVSLWSQTSPTLPMTIIGDVYNGGDMISMGTVHIKALPLDTGKVYNEGYLKMDSLILYSNDYSEGLLMNMNAASANTIAVRKSFVNSNSWYMMSFPFDVLVATQNASNASGLVNPLNSQHLTRNVNFEVQVYDPQQRADQGDRGTVTDPTWKIDPAITTLTRGQACRVAVKLTSLVPAATDTTGMSFSVDFFATDTTGILKLGNKTVSLTYTQATNHDSFLTHKSEGWNAIGGLNTTNFKMSSASINYDRDGIFYWDDGGSDWEPFNLTDASRLGTLRPYAPIFVQTTSTTEATDGFTYLGSPSTTGLTLGIDDPSYLFRSSTDVSFDEVKLQLIDAKTMAENKAVPVYFKFNNNYSNFFKTSEDEYTLLTSSNTKSVIWAIAQEEGSDANNLLFIDALPYNPNEVSLGVNVPAAGEYIFSLQTVITKESIKNAVLWDKETNKKTDLVQYDYHFQAAKAFSAEDRFVIYFNTDVVTSVDDPMKSPEIYAYTTNNILTVKNLHQGDKVQVLDVTGRIIAAGMASGNTYSVALNQKGVYIVNARGGEKILKVLNK